MRKLIIAAGLLATLNGCATITDTQATCQSSTYAFVDMVGCLNEQVRKNPSLVSNSLRAEYMAYANMLAEQVSYGQVSDANARYMLASKLADVQARHDVSNREAVSQALLVQQLSKPANPSSLGGYKVHAHSNTYRQPTNTTCTTSLGRLMCTTY